MMPNMPLTQDEPCILLQRVEPDGELMEVASGTVMVSRDMHHAKLAQDVMKVRLALVVPEYRDITPYQPPGADEDDIMVLGDCTSWIMTWPKNQIHLGGGSSEC